MLHFFAFVQTPKKIFCDGTSLSKATRGANGGIEPVDGSDTTLVQKGCRHRGRPSVDRAHGRQNRVGHDFESREELRDPR